MANEADAPSSSNPAQVNNNSKPDAQPRQPSTLRSSSSTGLRSSPNNSRNPSPARKPSSTQQPPVSKPAQPAASRAITSATPAPPSMLRSTSDVARPTTTSQAPRSQSTTAPSSPLASVPPSPRIKSPPPSASRRSSVSSTKLSDSDTSEQPKSSRSTSAAPSPKEVSDPSSSPTHGPQPLTSKATRAPTGRGSRLETVQEGDHSASPKEPSALALRAEDEASKRPADDPDATPKRSATTSQVPVPQADAKQSVPGTPTRKRSTSSLAAAKSRTSANEGSSKVMTVETETVSTIPQTAIASAADRAASGRGEGSASLRVKPSQETMRPKKDKKRVVKKPQSTTAGSSKADIFEAKVASEIEGEDSDSDETFVYESNPHEPRTRQRHHSRTPSTTSTNTIPDRSGGASRNTSAIHSGDRPMRPKRSMKFASGRYTGSMDDDNSERDGGTVRTPTARGSMRRELHGKRLGRSEGTYESSLENESPFSQAARLRVATDSKQSTKSASLRSLTPTQRTPMMKHGHSDLEYDSGNGFDEQTPLLRTSKTRHARHGRHARLEDIEYVGQQRAPWARRAVGYIIALVAALLLVVFGAGGLYLTALPLYGVTIQEIRNVLASEQEIMLDLLVKATNPNIAQINVRSMDINIFAKSKHISDKALRVAGGVDHGTDPIEDPDGDNETMLLGRIFRFDSALAFDPSPLHRVPQRSVGELRLARPGKNFETGGSARWERVLQHQFVLIVRGVLKYELPLSRQAHTASVGARVLVIPEEGVDGAGNLRVIQLDHLPPQVGGDEELMDLDPKNVTTLLAY